MDASPLKRLPAELRNRVYELVVIEPDDIVINTDTDKPKAARQPPVALMETCRQIRAETSAMFYSVNSFVFPTEFFEAGGRYSRTKGAFRLDPDDRLPKDCAHPTPFDRVECHRFKLVKDWFDMIGTANSSHIHSIRIHLGTFCLIPMALLSERWQILHGSSEEFDLPKTKLRVSLGLPHFTNVYSETMLEAGLRSKFKQQESIPFDFALGDLEQARTETYARQAELAAELANITTVAKTLPHIRENAQRYMTCYRALFEVVLKPEYWQ